MLNIVLLYCIVIRPWPFPHWDEHGSVHRDSTDRTTPPE
jgi:hypothetical protein